MDTTLSIDETQEHAVDVKSAEFEWVALPEETSEKPVKGDSSSEEVAPAAAAPFRITGLDLKIPKGSLTAITGAVGSGKSSLCVILTAARHLFPSHAVLPSAFKASSARCAGSRDWSRSLARSLTVSSQHGSPTNL